MKKEKGLRSKICRIRWTSNVFTDEISLVKEAAEVAYDQQSGWDTEDGLDGEASLAKMVK